MMIFACWAWRDSYFLYRYAYRGGRCIAHGSGGISFVGGLRLFKSSSGSMPPERSWRLETFPPPLLIRGRDKTGTPGTEQVKTELPKHVTIKESWIDAATREPRTIRIFIPYWLILSGTAALWLALLFWRARRRARLHVLG